MASPTLAGFDAHGNLFVDGGPGFGQGTALGEISGGCNKNGSLGGPVSTTPLNELEYGLGFAFTADIAVTPPLGTR